MIELPTGYYLANFRTLLDFVRLHYADILSPTERAYADIFATLDESAARLYVRLISRKGPHFLANGLHYGEIPDLHGAAVRLAELGYLAIDPTAEPAELLALLNRAELEALIRALGEPGRSLKQLKKPELLAHALTLAEPDNLRLAFRTRHPVYSPRHTELLLIYRLLFFGNMSQDLSEFVLLDLGLLAYERVPLRAEDRLFRNRALLDHSLTLLRLRELSWQASQLQDTALLAQICAALPETLGEPSLERRAGAILVEAARCFERAGDLDLALTTYARTARPPSRERQARIHEKRGQLATAEALCQDIARQPQEEAELEFAAFFSAKLAKKSGLSAKAAAKLRHPGELLTLPRIPEQRVEEAVLADYARRGVAGFYGENQLWSTLFGLLFWDIVFMPVRGAFFNHYQRAPKDLHSADFRTARAEAIAQRLAEIRKGQDLQARLRRTMIAKEGIANPFVPWRQFEPDQLDAVVSAVPPTHLAAICDRLATNPGEFRSGLPDLIVFPDNGYQLVEVKGLGDQLQPNQSRWLLYFQRQGIPYQVTKVKWLAM